MLDRRVDVVASWALADEIARVLRSPKLRRYQVTEADVAEALSLLAPFLPHVDLAPPLRDPTDVPVAEAAVVGDAEAIVTGDADLLEDDAARAWLASRGIRVMTAKELLSLLGPR